MTDNFYWNLGREVLLTLLFLTKVLLLFEYELILVELFMDVAALSTIMMTLPVCRYKLNNYLKLKPIFVELFRDVATRRHHL